MDKTKLGLIGALTTLAIAPVGAASAAPLEAQPIPAASSYADLLDPVPNAVERLALVQQSDHDGARLIEAQYGPGPMMHHHHHHHNNYYRHRRWRRHNYRHHHHHHHNNY